MSKLEDLDKNHPFYSDKAIRDRKALLKKLEEEEVKLASENRRRYKEHQKQLSQKRRINGNKDNAK